MKILVTGAAGFIGYHVCTRLLTKGFEVIGIDNINDYYIPELKYDRLNQLGITKENGEKFGKRVSSKTYGEKFVFIRLNLEDAVGLSTIFQDENFDKVCHLAAQVGVRYSLKNPRAYIDSNIVGFLNILECCKNNEIEHLVYASSSSVYGLNKKIPFSVTDSVDNPISIYAASKKSNELMAHTYSHLYNIPTTGLRFFTVYGPWGRPDMAMYLFTDAIAKEQPIKVFNNGNMKRDFTYVDDIAKGIIKVLETNIADRVKTDSIFKVYNIGNTKSVSILDFITEIEKNLGKKATKQMLPIQPGDVENTWADVSALQNDFDYRPSTSIEKGVQKFVEWYLKYHIK